MRREKTQINKIRNEKGDITANTNESKEPLGNTLKTCIQMNRKI
jgi:hypothetical protein